MFVQACRNLDFSPAPIILGLIVKLLSVPLNRPLFRAHYCKLYQDVENLVATENRQKWRESTETHMIQIRTIWR